MKGEREVLGLYWVIFSVSLLSEPPSPQEDEEDPSAGLGSELCT